jgi:hypothetical protein
VALVQEQLAAALKQAESSAALLAAVHQQVAELEAAASTKAEELQSLRTGLSSLKQIHSDAQLAAEARVAQAEIAKIELEEQLRATLEHIVYVRIDIAPLSSERSTETKTHSLVAVAPSVADVGQAEPFSCASSLDSNLLSSPSSSSSSSSAYALSLLETDLRTAQESFREQVASLSRATTLARTEAAHFRNELAKAQAQCAVLVREKEQVRQDMETQALENVAARKAGDTTAAMMRLLQQLYEEACLKTQQSPRSMVDIAAAVSSNGTSEPSVELSAALSTSVSDSSTSSVAAAATMAVAGTTAPPGGTDLVARLQAQFSEKRAKLTHYVKLLRGKDEQIAGLQRELRQLRGNDGMVTPMKKQQMQQLIEPSPLQETPQQQQVPPSVAASPAEHAAQQNGIHSAAATPSAHLQQQPHPQQQRTQQPTPLQRSRPPQARPPPHAQATPNQNGSAPPLKLRLQPPPQEPHQQPLTQPQPQLHQQQPPEKQPQQQPQQAQQQPQRVQKQHQQPQQRQPTPRKAPVNENAAAAPALAVVANLVAAPSATAVADVEAATVLSTPAKPVRRAPAVQRGATAGIASTDVGTVARASESAKQSAVGEHALEASSITLPAPSPSEAAAPPTAAGPIKSAKKLVVRPTAPNPVAPQPPASMEELTQVEDEAPAAFSYDGFAATLAFFSPAPSPPSDSASAASSSSAAASHGRRGSEPLQPQSSPSPRVHPVRKASAPKTPLAAAAATILASLTSYRPNGLQLGLSAAASSSAPPSTPAYVAAPANSTAPPASSPPVRVAVINPRPGASPAAAAHHPSASPQHPPRHLSHASATAVASFTTPARMSAPAAAATPTTAKRVISEQSAAPQQLPPLDNSPVEHVEWHD